MKFVRVQYIKDIRGRRLFRTRLVEFDLKANGLQWLSNRGQHGKKGFGIFPDFNPLLPHRVLLGVVKLPHMSFVTANMTMHVPRRHRWWRNQDPNRGPSRLVPETLTPKPSPEVGEDYCIRGTICPVIRIQGSFWGLSQAYH